MSRYKAWISVTVATLLIGCAHLALAETSEPEEGVKIATVAKVTAGYRGTSIDDHPGRAVEYDSLESSPTLKANLFTDRGTYYLDLGVDFLNDDDFSAELRLTTRRLFRLDLRTERFFHNLDHIPYDSGQDGSRPDAYFPVTATRPFPPNDTATVPASPRAYYTDQNPGADYGLRLDVSEAKIRVKAPDYPAHLNLAYWRYEKSGAKQLRFVDDNCATACHMQSKTRDIDRVTEEVKVGIDAHAGFIDIALETLFRTFRNRESTPVDNFGYYLIPGARTAGWNEHDEDPDSKLQELTLKLNTAPSGGVVGSASFTLGERENRSDLSSVHPIRAKTDYFKTAADVTYTPSENWTVNFRHRLLDMDSDNTDRYQDYYTDPASDLSIRDSMDFTRAWYEAIVNYRPSRRFTLKAELRHEQIERDETGEPTTVHNGYTRTIVPAWDLPDKEAITRVKLGFNSSMLEKSALKLNGWLTIQTNDDPAYGTSFSESREMSLAASYTSSMLWGLTANVKLLDEENDDHNLGLTFAEYALDRNREQQNVSVGTWVIPLEGVSFDLNYGYLRSAIEQDLLFGGQDGYAIENESVDYRQTVQTVTVGITWQALKDLTGRIEGYHIRSKASYSPDFPEQSFAYSYWADPPDGYTFYAFPGTASSADLHEISKLDLRQNGVRGRIDWKINEDWSCGAEATFDDYDESGGSDIFDGSVQTCMLSFSRSW